MLLTPRTKSLGALAALTVLAVPAAALVAVAAVRIVLRRGDKPAPSGRTVLLTGGKMTKSLQLARMFASLGDRVVVAETPSYRYCGTRFSRAVDRFAVVPKIEGDGEAYVRALVGLAHEESVDLFVPVASPAAALYDARAKPLFPAHTDVFHFDEELVAMLDDKFAFCEQCHAYGLSAPEVHRVESCEQLLEFEFPSDKRYILKSIVYDPVFRLDMRTLPHPGWRERVRSLPISARMPWVLQEYVEGREVCTHSTVREGTIELYICCDSSPFQVNYEMLDMPAVHDWVASFVGQLGGTGQASFDFLVRADGVVMPIECNPRTHSAITLFHDQLPAAAAYYPSDARDDTEYRPLPHTRPTYWLYHELWRWLTGGTAAGRTGEAAPARRAALARVLAGKEAVFSWDDPLPFFVTNHVQIPFLLAKSLLAGGTWERIDFNIGKLVEAGGD